MLNFISRNKAFLGIVLATFVLIFGGVFLFSKGGTSTNSIKVSDEVLTPQDSYRFVNSETPVMLTEFGDFQCPACGLYQVLVKKLLADFPGKLNFVFRHFPLSQHPNAPISSYAAEAAGLQGKFWEMYDKIYETQSSWSGSPEARSIFLGYARDLGLDMNKFTADLDSQAVKDKVARDTNDGNLLRIDSTPTFYLNGVKITPPGSYDGFKKLIEEAIPSK
jgi:protein-disulfide isomerase